MNLDQLGLETLPPRPRWHDPIDRAEDGGTPPHSLKAPSLSSTPSESNWDPSFDLPPLPSLRRERDRLGKPQSPEFQRQRAESGAYYAAAWGSPYATPSPRRSHRSTDWSAQRSEIQATPRATSAGRHSSPLSIRASAESHKPHTRDPTSSEKRLRLKTKVLNPLSEKPIWLSDSDDTGSEITAKEGDNTPTRRAYLDNWGISPDDAVTRRSRRHQFSESVATLTPGTFHDADPAIGESGNRPQALSPAVESTMAEQESEAPATASKPLPDLPPRGPVAEEDMKATDSPVPEQRPRVTSMQSYQRPKKKVVWKGKNCIIALPLTDREAAGLPPLVTPQDVKERIEGWIKAGYNINGFELAESVGGSGQSRPVYPDPTEMQAERTLRRYQVHIPNQADWDAWVNHLKEEKLRALGVSPSNSEAPPSTKSPFSTSLSRVSSGYPGLAASPPVASSSSASNPLRATSNPFSPSLMSSGGISPQSISMTSPQFNGLPRPLQGHGYKQSVAPPNSYGRITSPFDGSISQASSLGYGARPNIPPLSSRQNSFSPNHPIQLPNLGEVLSPQLKPRGRGQNTTLLPEQRRYGQGQSEDHSVSGHRHPPALSPDLSQHADPNLRTPDPRGPSPPSIEIAHPTPKSHRHNLSMALQRGIDEAEAATRERRAGPDGDEPQSEQVSSRKNSMMDEEPPILRRPETMSTTDERSEIETNPSLAATPLLMDDKNPFMNWQALSDAAKAESKHTAEANLSTTKLNVQAKEFDPQAVFSSSNFTFGANNDTAPFAFSQPSQAPVSRKDSAQKRLSLNADAPAFTPSFISQSTSKETPFKFSSATFNVEAPVFNPSKSAATEFLGNVGSSGSPEPNATNSIFGTVIVDPGSKVSRRPAKSVPIQPPNPKEMGEESSVSSEDEDDSDSGRPMAPTDRQKRARRTDSDGDRSPVYADSAPFRHERILSEIVDDIDQNGPPPESPKKSLDGWSYIPADEEPLESLPEPPSAEKDNDAPQESDREFTMKSQDDVAKFNEARPPFDAPPVYSTEREAQEEAIEEPSTPEKTEQTPRAQVRKPKSSLSALAQPFEFKTFSSSPYPSSSAKTPARLQGLEASRYAASSSPPQSSADLTASLSSPPADLYHYVEKDTQSVSDEDDVVEVIEEPSIDKDTQSVSDEDDVVEVIEEPSTEEDVEHQEVTARVDDQPKKLESQAQVDHEVPDMQEQGHQDEVELDMPRLPLRHQDDPLPSFEEIDAVMKQFEVHPELGIERNDTPIQSTPLVDMHLGGNFRSDAPSPSPPRRRGQDGRGEVSYPPSIGLGIGVHNLNTGRANVSDWDDTLPAPEAAKVQLRSQFFDGHVNDLVDGILENRLGPLERTLQTIQHSLALMATGSRPKSSGRSMSTDIKNSDADDEDDYDAFEGFSSYRARSPSARRNERRQDKIRAAVAEALAAYQPPQPPQSSIDMTEFSAIVQEMREMAQHAGSQNTQNQLKTIVEDVISHHPRLRGSRVQHDHESAEHKYMPQIDGLESMLKISKEHAAEEVQLRRKAEAEVTELRLRLRMAEEEAAQHRESSEEAQQTLVAFVEEKKSYEKVRSEVEAVNLKNAALESTLEEYRVSSDEWREDIRAEREKNKELKSALRDLQQHFEDQSHSRQSLRSKVERLQGQMTQAVQDLHAEQAEWRHKEHDLLSQLAQVQHELDREQRDRQRTEAELRSLDEEHKANLQVKVHLEQAQADVSRLNELVASLSEQNRNLDTKAFNLDRELAHTINTKEAELATTTAKLQAELDSARGQLHSIKTDSEAQISRLQSRLDHAELDIEDQRAKQDALLSETVEAHKEAMHEANERRESALEDQHQVHEKKLGDLRDRHTRELHNSFDNRSRLEHHLNEKLSLSDDKVKHLESKIADLEERLDITKSAARAAVEAATAKGVNLPTPASSVIASPPQRATSASISFVRGTEIPEKISPQALRESIMVLQDQLQNREQTIEKLEAELSAVDKDAPNKLKDRDTEIGWLRELLSVRVDDLEEIINTTSQPDFDRETVKDAAIRLRANLQMEQQLKERVAGGLASPLPSISTLSSYAQSPRALPMAAAAAWGNWRRARDTSIGALSDLATNLGNQTPSKSTIGSPASFLSGIMTPPGTTQKLPGSAEMSAPPPSMRPLAAAAAARKSSSEARPLRAYSSQPRALSSKQAEKRPQSSQSEPRPLRPESPHTPIQARRPILDLAEDVDEDASPLDGKDVSVRRLQDVELIADIA
ncbi:hypothetical protein LTR47_003275 [Exophiala xenobiotica]|nr:hypothetical protein LTR47_003275 [Exophiala xenobiotica]KAK5243591.1 hypothetical protein LTS06_010682 [Exophiala xenobiotica]KAK5354031.1 hypothetical protein LTR61_002727 [Exophiala xenobiotica]KAK5364144.1 hypothetical protein LTS03_009451 [Exophiala xenobiotica]KAK5378487.1 hypothetical protein LTR11_004182 [Exophiala xenobiotica]